MAEIGFYHLTRTEADGALPALLGRTLASGHRAVVLCGSPAHVAALDEWLWACTDPDWLPHGAEGTGDPDLQPIWLTTRDEAPNGAQYLFLMDGMRSARLDSYLRVFDLFDGNDAASVESARERWREAEDHARTYWQQGERGWVKK